MIEGQGVISLLQISGTGPVFFTRSLDSLTFEDFNVAS